MNMHPYPLFAQALAPLAVVAALAVVPRPVAANPPPMGGPRPNLSSMLESRIDKLDLDQETRKAVYAIIDGSKANERETKETLRDEHEALRALLDTDEPDEGAVLAHAERIGSLTTELRKQELRTLLAVRAQLTPEQRGALRPPHDASHHGCSEHSRSKD